MDDAEARREVINTVFTGVNQDDYTLVSNAIASYKRRSFWTGYKEGHLQGFLIGLVLGAGVGVTIAGLIIAYF